MLILLLKKLRFCLAPSGDQEVCQGPEVLLPHPELQHSALYSVGFEQRGDAEASLHNYSKIIGHATGDASWGLSSDERSIRSISDGGHEEDSTHLGSLPHVDGAAGVRGSDSPECRQFRCLQCFPDLCGSAACCKGGLRIWGMRVRAGCFIWEHCDVTQNTIFYHILYCSYIL